MRLALCPGQTRSIDLNIKAIWHCYLCIILGGGVLTGLGEISCCILTVLCCILTIVFNVGPTASGLLQSSCFLLYLHGSLA